MPLEPTTLILKANNDGIINFWCKSITPCFTLADNQICLLALAWYPQFPHSVILVIFGKCELCSMVRILLLFNKTWKESHQAKKGKYISNFFPESNTNVKFWQMHENIFMNMLPKYQCLQQSTMILLQCLVLLYYRSISKKIVHGGVYTFPNLKCNHTEESNFVCRICLWILLTYSHHKQFMRKKSKLKKPLFTQPPKILGEGFFVS